MNHWVGNKCRANHALTSPKRKDPGSDLLELAGQNGRFRMVRGVSVMAEAQDERMTLRLEAVTDTP